MSIVFLNGSGSLICDGVDAGQIEFNIAESSDGLDMTRRGKLWGNKQAGVVAMNAQKVELISSDGDERLPLDVEEVDRHGGVSFNILQTDRD
ncbi:hypothetical protein Brsp06_04446 [Brucella sp. NBRC 13694]|uniref:hypothetical protein n=1 Tax=Brucella sp. NBRC 13694 TaxID=3075482 RepID=UPI0028AE9903|nr:hypothetical protein [Brucella anthropi]